MDTIDLSRVNGDVVCEVHGGDGNDIIHGGRGNDLLYGDAGEDDIWGEGGNDLVEGGIDDDELWGGSEADTVTGGDGNDTLRGEAGKDVLIGGAGDDTFYRSAGGDVYSLSDFGSEETVVTEGTIIDDSLDFSTKTQELTFLLTSDGGTFTVYVGFDKKPGLSGKSYTDFASVVKVANANGLKSILGGARRDTFHVWGATGNVVLDGGKGNDRFFFYPSSTELNVTVNDTSNPWDSDNLITVIGSDSLVSPDDYTHHEHAGDSEFESRHQLRRTSHHGDR